MQGQSLIANLRHLVEQIDSMENNKQINLSVNAQNVPVNLNKHQNYAPVLPNPGSSRAARIVMKLGVSGSDLSRVVHAVGRRGSKV